MGSGHIQQKGLEGGAYPGALWGIPEWPTNP